MRFQERDIFPCSQTDADSDAELVAETLDGDSQAFEELLCRHGSRLYRLAESIVGEGSAADVLQRGLIKIYEKLDGLRDPGSFGSWAYRIVKNEALMEIRSSDRRPEIGFGDLGPGRDDERHFESTVADWRIRGDEVAENRELREKIVDAISELEDKYHDPFVMYEIDGMSLSDIADEIALSKPGVKSRLHRARKKIRVTLDRYLRETSRSSAA